MSGSGRGQRRKGRRPGALPAVRAALVVSLVTAAGCAPPPAAPLRADRSPRAPVPVTRYLPSRDLGPLFAAVQLGGIFPDSKTFVDARPREAPADVAARYLAGRSRSGFDLAGFVRREFTLPQAGAGPVVSLRPDSMPTMVEHIRALWPTLTRPADRPDSRSSLIALPHPYVVPGGRFREVYYWDSYFTMLGLVASGRLDLVRSMLDDFAWLVERFGHVPNGSRTYYLSRSQPPFLAAMVGLYAAAADSAGALRWLAALEAEHAFWMDGADRIAPGEAFRRVVRLADGSILNRYWDDRDDPRPESFREDFSLGRTLSAADRPDFFRNIRATAESGWDFSSRWMRDPADLRTLETTALVPVDLNSLLYNEERTIAALLRFRDRPGDADAARRFDLAADERRRDLIALAWDPEHRFFFDIRWRTGARVTDRPTLAAAVPLFFGLASPDQGRAVADVLARDFLRPGGFVTTRIASGQQWDAPNGWPPLEWMAIQALRRYGCNTLADTATARWLRLVRKTYRATGRMMEKYDVVDLNRPAGGGEYLTQDGFGWTNGVALALLAGTPTWAGVDQSAAGSVRVRGRPDRFGIGGVEILGLTARRHRAPSRPRGKRAAAAAPHDDNQQNHGGGPEQQVVHSDSSWQNCKTER